MLLTPLQKATAVLQTLHCMTVHGGGRQLIVQTQNVNLTRLQFKMTPWVTVLGAVPVSNLADFISFDSNLLWS